MKKKFLLPATIVFLFVGLNFANADCGENEVNCFNCGSDCTARLSDGTMTVSGSGAMTDYSTIADRPWNSISSSITKVVIGGDITTVGKNSFFGIATLTNVFISKNVTTVNEMAFASTSLSNLTFEKGSNLQTIKGMAFGISDSQPNGTTLKSVQFPASLETIEASAFQNHAELSISFEEGSKLKKIDSWAFQENNGNIILPDSFIKSGTLESNAFLWAPGTFYCLDIEACKKKIGNNFSSQIKLYEKKGNFYIVDGEIYSDLANKILATFEKNGSYYMYNGKMYSNLDNLLDGIEMKRIYTVEEATAAVHQGGKNKFILRYR